MKKYILLFLSLLLLISMVLIWLETVPSSFARDSHVTVLILGDSLSAGLGVETQQVYPVLLEDMLNPKGR
jgi:acyl-CoA thioesterase-1